MLTEFGGDHDTALFICLRVLNMRVEFTVQLSVFRGARTYGAKFVCKRAEAFFRINAQAGLYMYDLLWDAALLTFPWRPRLLLLEGPCAERPVSASQALLFRKLFESSFCLQPRLLLTDILKARHSCSPSASFCYVKGPVAAFMDLLSRKDYCPLLHA